jgi:hypothetical protein
MLVNIMSKINTFYISFLVISNDGLENYHWTELNTIYDYDDDLIKAINNDNQVLSEKSSKMYCLLSVLRNYISSVLKIYRYSENLDTHLEIYDIESLSCRNIKTFDTMPMKLRLNVIKLIEDLDEKTYSNIEDDLILRITPSYQEML